jgi:hypothetical protein
VNLYTPSGDPICTIGIPEVTDLLAQIAYDGRRVVIASEEGLFIFGLAGPLQRSARPLKARSGGFYYPYILNGGRELAIFDGKSPVLERYELP